MHKLDILHIYPGTPGAAGLYLDEIFQSLNAEFRQDIIVNYYYPFDNGKKYFYKFSELYVSKIKNKKIRLFIRYIEHFIGLFRSYLYMLKKKPRIINYNLSSDLIIELIFLLIIKYVSHSKVMITCHDIMIPKQRINRKKKFYLIADYLLVHYEESKMLLKSIYNIDNTILVYPFPIMDLRKLFPEKKQEPNNSFITTIGMFGHFREEKGLDILVNSWISISSKYSDMKLVIAGNFSKASNTLLEKITNTNVLVIESYINDSMLFDLMQMCDIIVLPYRWGTNSGFPSMILSLDKLLLTSNIPMFKNNPLILDTFLFQSTDSTHLTEKIAYLKSLTNKDIANYRNNNQQLLKEYKHKFDNEIIITYRELLEKL